MPDIDFWCDAGTFHIWLTAPCVGSGIPSKNPVFRPKGASVHRLSHQQCHCQRESLGKQRKRLHCVAAVSEVTPPVRLSILCARLLWSSAGITMMSVVPTVPSERLPTFMMDQRSALVCLPVSEHIPFTYRHTTNGNYPVVTVRRCAT